MKKYILGILGVLLFALGSYGQVIPKPNPTAVGIGYKRLLADSTLFVPTGNGGPFLNSNNVNKRGAIYVDSTNKKLYVFYPSDSTWKESGTDTASLSARIDARVKYADTSSMLAPYLRTANSHGVPSGGTSGQLLSKNSDSDYDLVWIDNYADWTSLIKQQYKATEPITKGQAVYVSGADGTNALISKASNASEITSSKTIGLLAQTLSTNGKGFVVTEGLLGGLNTATAIAGDPVWLGVNGDLIFGYLNKPHAPAHLVYLGIVTRANGSNGEILIKPQNGFEVKELHDVSAQSPSNNDGLFYNNSNSLWETKSIATALGYTPANNSLIVKYTDTANMLLPYLRSANAASTYLTQANAASTYYLQTNPSGYITASAIAGKVNYTDTANMLLPYLRSASAASTYLTQANAASTYLTQANAASTYYLQTNPAGYITASAIAGKVNYTDTAAMLSPYLRSAAAASTYLTQSTAASTYYLQSNPAGYITSAAISGKVNYTDTANMLLPYYRTATATVALAAKQNQLNGTGFVKASGTTISYDNSTYYLASNPNGYTSNTGTVTSVTATAGTGISITGSPITTSGTLNITNTAPDQTVVFTNGTGISVTGVYPNFTVTNTSPSSGGTVTSIATTGPITGGTITGSGTIGITQATTTTNGYLSSTDWNTFNNKQSALTNPVTGTGTTNYLPKFTGTSTIGNSQIFDNGTNVGIGTATPSYKLEMYNAAGASAVIGAATGKIYVYGDDAGGTVGTLSSIPLRFATNGTEKMRLDISGNLGLGVTPSAWLSGYPVIQMPQLSIFSGGGGGGFIFGNAYLNTSGSFTYQNSGLGASAYNNQGSAHQWSVAPSGIAGNPITFTQAMTLTSGGNLLVGTTTDAGYKLDVNGTGRFSGALSGTSATFSGAINLANNNTFPTGAGIFQGSGYLQIVSGANGFTINNNANTITNVMVTNGGNVGIGTSSPAVKFEVAGSGSTAFFRNPSSTAATTYITVVNANNTSNGLVMAHISDGTGYFGTQNSADLRLVTGDTERMRITSGGVTQIANSSGTQGTLVGSERLNVNGGIYAYGDITSGGTITFANNVVNYGGNTTYKGATGSGDVTLSNNGSALLVTGPLQKNYGSSIKFMGNGSSSYDVDFLNAGFTTKTVKVLGSLHLETTGSSFVIPRMTTAERDALNANNKIAGAMIYNTSVGHFQGYNGTGWTNFW